MRCLDMGAQCASLTLLSVEHRVVSQPDREFDEWNSGFAHVLGGRSSDGLVVVGRDMQHGTVRPCARQRGDIGDRTTEPASKRGWAIAQTQHRAVAVVVWHQQEVIVRPQLPLVEECEGALIAGRVVEVLGGADFDLVVLVGVAMDAWSDFHVGSRAVR